MEPEFLGLWDVIRIRDVGLLASAVALPRAGTVEGYLHEDIFAMAAACLFHIMRDHPFVDGNKRTGAVAAIVFLAMNGTSVEADESGLEALVRSIADGRAGKDDAAAFFRERADHG